MAPTRVVRIRKLGKNTSQQVLREDEIDSAEYKSLQRDYSIETGVEKSEEKVHKPDLLKSRYQHESHDTR
jgi:hypothetical protein